MPKLDPRYTIKKNDQGFLEIYDSEIARHLNPVHSSKSWELTAAQLAFSLQSCNEKDKEIARLKLILNKYVFTCEICGKPVPDFEPEYCCSGLDCGCMGQPILPCVCSVRCRSAFYGGTGKPMEQRRIDAGISKFEVQP